MHPGTGGNQCGSRKKTLLWKLRALQDDSAAAAVVLTWNPLFFVSDDLNSKKGLDIHSLFIDAIIRRDDLGAQWKEMTFL